MVPLVRVLDLSPDGQRTPGGGSVCFFSGANLLTHSPILCLFLSSPSAARLVLFLFVFGCDLTTVSVTCVQPQSQKKKGGRLGWVGRKEGRTG